MTATEAGANRPTTVLASIAEKTGWRQISGPLFRKYVGLFLAVVCIALLSNGLFEIFFSYREHTESLVRIQREQAEGAAEKIGLFIKEIESQMGWTTQLTWSASTIEQRRFDGLRLLRQVPAITELAQLDATGKEQLRVSRLAMDLGPQHERLLTRPQIHRRGSQKGLLRPGLFPKGVRALHDLVGRWHSARRRRQRRRGQSEADLGGGIANQGRQSRPSLCNRCGWPPDCTSGHQPRSSQYRHDEAASGRGGPYGWHRAGAGGARHPWPKGAFRLCSGRAAGLARSASLASL